MSMRLGPMRLFVFGLIAGLAAAAGLADELSAKRILIITGEDYPGHHWRETVPILKAQLEQDSRLHVEVLDDLKKLATADFSRYAALVLHFKNYDPKVPGRPAFNALSNYVRGGGGLVVVHFASGAFQEFSKDYETLVGRVWDPQRGHDPFGPFAVRIIRHDHPITRGLTDFETTDELYTCLVGKAPIEILAAATSKVDGKIYPMAFTLAVGKGRVFHSPLGHDQAIGSPATGRLFRRATAWAAQLEPQSEPAR